MALTPKQAAFVREYLVDHNATQAAIRAGYSANSAHSCGPRLLENAGVASAIQAAEQKAAKKTELSLEYVLGSLKNVAERCQQAVPVMVKVDGDLVQKVDENGEGVWEFDSAGANRALELLGKHLGAFVERQQLEGKDGAPLSVKFVVKERRA